MGNFISTSTTTEEHIPGHIMDTERDDPLQGQIFSPRVITTERVSREKETEMENLITIANKKIALNWKDESEKRKGSNLKNDMILLTLMEEILARDLCKQRDLPFYIVDGFLRSENSLRITCPYFDVDRHRSKCFSKHPDMKNIWVCNYDNSTMAKIFSSASGWFEHTINSMT